MYKDTDSVKVFERQHARDVLVRMARTLPDPPDADLMSSHSASARQEARIMRLVLFAMVLTICATLSWFIFASGSALYSSLKPYRPACIFPTEADGCFGSQPAAHP